MTSTSRFNLDVLKTAFAGIETISDLTQVTKLSQDYYNFSPVLIPLLSDKIGDLVVRPTQEADVLRIVSECVKHRIPITIRGAGTGNYGQCVPLQGGVILDMSKMQQILWIKPGMARVEAGVKLAQLDKETRKTGWEMRMAPSTYRTATIGGFFAGGSGGIGSINYGFLSDRGNLLAAKVITLEAEPRVLELRGDDVQKVNHAYGTNGIITEVEVPLAPAYPWVEAIATFPSFIQAAKFGYKLGNSDGMVKKLISIHADPIPTYFTALRQFYPDQSHIALLIIAASSLEPLNDLVKEFGGEITYTKSPEEGGKAVNLGEFTWNHTTLHARNVDPSITYLQSLFPADANLTLLEEMYHQFGDEVMMHLEIIRAGGIVIPAALQLVRFTTAERLQEIIRYHEDRGIYIANPHTYILEDGGRKVIDPIQLEFKRQVDPHGLLNPGKMKAWLEMMAESPSRI